MNENKNLKKGLGIHARRFIAYVVLILVTFACLFWFYVLFINATRSNGELDLHHCQAHICWKTGRICYTEHFRYGRV